MEDRAQKLLELHKKWAATNGCSLKKVATQAVFGDGNPQAEIVFIGEAPGKKEDIAGKPFVGAAGKFLDEMLAATKLKRSDVYITNIVKYRPPNNRDPLSEEIASCAEWLHEELTFIQPKLIVFLGRHSMHHFFPEAEISESHGKLLMKKIAGFPTEYFLALYHPAAALYNGSMRDTLITDFKEVPKIIEKIKSERLI